MDEPSSRRLQDLGMLYRTASDRRLQYENLLWQVPTISLTAQAFLFSIAMGAGNDPVARVASSLLALIVSFISIMLMASHRLAERKDAQWLERFEQEMVRAGTWGVTGAVFDAESVAGLEAGWVGNLIPMRQMFTVWVGGLAVFGLTAIFMILRTVFGLLQ